MTHPTLVKPALALLLATSLAGCLGNSNSGGGAGGGGATPADFDAAFDKTAHLGPSTKPITGKATYEGQVEILTNANPDNAKEAVFGDLAMDIDFAATSRPVSGTMGNFAGEVNGEAVEIEGTLSTANAPSSAPNEITVTTSEIPAPGSGTVTSTGLAATFQGDLRDPASKLSGEAQMTLLGTFVGDSGQGLIGQNGGIIRPDDGSADFIAGGRFYANRK